MTSERYSRNCKKTAHGCSRPKSGKTENSLQGTISAQDYNTFSNSEQYGG